MEIIFYIKINNCTPNVLYNNSIAMKLLKGKVGEFWWETRLWLKLIVGHCILTSNCPLYMLLPYSGENGPFSFYLVNDQNEGILIEKLRSNYFMRYISL
jgi:hypothetical protein